LVPRGAPLPSRARPPRVADADDDLLAALVGADADYGRIVCQCAMVSAGEVRAAIHGAVPARTLDALKRRLWVMAGACQGSLCAAQLTALLARECGGDPAQVRKHTVGSELLAV